MDPNANLNAIRALISEYQSLDHTDASLPELALEIVQSFEALDEWLRWGGALPDEWNKLHNKD